MKYPRFVGNLTADTDGKKIDIGMHTDTLEVNHYVRVTLGRCHVPYAVEIARIVEREMWGLQLLYIVFYQLNMIIFTIIYKSDIKKQNNVIRSLNYDTFLPIIES